MEFKIADGVPKHIGEFIKACYELSHLQEAHVAHLSEKHKGAETFNDSETVFMRAGIALLCSAWEAYVEALARNGINFLIENCKSSSDLPLTIRKNIAKEVKEDKNDLAPWTLAGDDWRKLVVKRYEVAIAKEANLLNSPKSSKVKVIFSDMLGIDDITQCWTWEFFDAKNVCELVDHLVEIRGNIAHGRAPSHPAETMRLVYLQAVVSQCAFLMNNHVREKLLAITGKDPWGLVRFNYEWKQFGIPVESSA